MEVIREPAHDVPVVADVDLCVVGGSCTGVFAAVAASRQGLKAAVIEANGFFGGVATASLVSIWHSNMDTAMKKQIIGGQTLEVIDRLKKRDAVIEKRPSGPSYFILNTPELMIELDELVKENSIRPFLHTRFCRPVVEDGVVKAAIVEDKTGRRAVRAKMFIDASGDGDLISRIPLPCDKLKDLQPPTAPMRVFVGQKSGKILGAVQKTVFSEEFRDKIPFGFMWGVPVCGVPGEEMIAGTRVPNADCSDADSLTAAEIEARRQVRAIIDIAKAKVRDCKDMTLAALPAVIGVRETRHAQCLHELTEQEVLNGTRFADAIANGSYRVDVHHSDKPGLTFRYLDGREEYVVPGQPAVVSRWRDKSADSPTFYQVPYRCLVPQGSKNVLVAGRLVDADRGAYGAIRVMVNCNQTGEAAGTAAAIALSGDKGVADVNANTLRSLMSKQGSIII
jgi:hypothetical protein